MVTNRDSTLRAARRPDPAAADQPQDAVWPQLLAREVRNGQCTQFPGDFLYLLPPGPGIAVEYRQEFLDFTSQLQLIASSIEKRAAFHRQHRRREQSLNQLEPR